MMNNIKVDKAKLLETLKENRAKHLAEYTEAVDGYREQAEKALRKRAIEIRDKKTLHTVIDDLPIPRSYVTDYDRAISMVDWSEDSVIELDPSDFASFVLDEWGWRGQFVGTTSMYNSSLG